MFPTKKKYESHRETVSTSFIKNDNVSNVRSNRVKCYDSTFSTYDNIHIFLFSIMLTLQIVTNIRQVYFD